MNDDPWWLQPCKDNIAKIPGAVMCSQDHCTDAQNYSHMICNCQAPYSNGCPDPPTPTCCSYTATSPVFVAGTPPCYCCCGCLANDTLVAVDSSERKAIQEFVVGDMVYVAMDPELQTWNQIPVQFSAGTGPESVTDMIQIRFGGLGDEVLESIIATRTQLFMVEGNKLKRASRLVPQHDRLMRSDGSLVDVVDLTTGRFKGGVHAIATSVLQATQWAGHLMVYNGIVGGDYALQVTDLELANPDLLVEGHADLPEFGTRAYAERYSHLFANTLRAHASGAEYSEAHADNFEPFEASVRPRPAEDGTAFLSNAQAEDILHNAPRQPPYSGAGKDILNYLFRMFRGFYPDVTFYLDDANELPNAYATREYGSSFVIVNGGLIRTDAIQYESLAFVIAHQICVLRGGEPKDENGYTCRAQADYVALTATFPYVWFGIYSYPMMQPAIDQITKLYGYIDEKNRAGVPGNTCNLIAIDCRLETMAAGATVGPIPQCAGGAPPPTLAVTGAKAAEDGLSVTVTFNEAVDPATAESPGAFAFAPLTPATQVTVAEDALSATVEAAFEPDTDYVVTVQDVLSANGNPLIPSKSIAKFKTPPPVGGNG
jgi:hypothetical protein